MKDIQELKKARKGQDLDQNEDTNPLFLKIHAVVIPHTLRVPMEKYAGMIDLINHIAYFKSKLDLYGTTDAIKCKMFSTTLIEMPILGMSPSLLSQLLVLNNSKDCLCRTFFTNKRQTQTLASMWLIN